MTNSQHTYHRHYRRHATSLRRRYGLRQALLIYVLIGIVMAFIIFIANSRGHRPIGPVPVTDMPGYGGPGYVNEYRP